MRHDAGMLIRSAAVALTMVAVSLPAAYASAVPLPASAPSGDIPVSTLIWTPCADDASQQCSTFRVPFHWGQTSGRHFTLAVRKLPALAGANDSASIRTLFTNPGGPGVPGAGSVSTFEHMTQLRQHFDIVGWDPRGVGNSTPLPRTCPKRDLWQWPPMTGAFTWTYVARQAIDTMSQQARTCWQRNRELRTHMGTNEVVQDLEAIRAAIGTPSMNYVGYSYGTTLGRTYAARYPDRVGVMLLDGVTSPVYTMAESLIAAQRGGTVAWRHASHLLDPSIRRLHARVAAHLGTIGSPDAEVINRWTFWTQTLSATGYPDPAAAVTDLTCEMATYLAIPHSACAASARAGSLPQFDIFPTPYLVDCADRAGRLTARQIGRSIEAHRTSDVAATNAIFFATFCSGMPPAWSPIATVTSLRLETPPLIINGLYDRRTPFYSARKTARAMTGSRIVSVNTGVHGLYAFQGGPHACHNRIGTRYLITGQLPRANVYCDSLD